MTPEEAFNEVNPEVGHFRIFGCSLYIHVPKEKRTKLDPSGRKGTYLWGTMSLQRNIRSTSLVRDRLSEIHEEMVPSERERYLRYIHDMSQL
jgi:hypothetical protein